MNEIHELDAKLIELKEWIINAGLALMGLNVIGEGVFLRNSDKVDEQAEEDRKYPTSTNRSFFALFEYYRFLVEEDIWQEVDRAHFDGVRLALREVSEKYLGLAQDPAKLKVIRPSVVNRNNIFTDAQLLISASILDNVRVALPNIDVNPDKIKKTFSKIRSDNIKELSKDLGGRLLPSGESHDFLTVHAIRAIDTCFPGQSSKTIGIIGERVYDTVLKSLAYHYSGVSSKFDPVELVFSLSLLNRFQHPDNNLITSSAISAICDSQEKDGGWPTTRVVSYESNDQVHIASYEVALSLCDLLLRKLNENEFQFFDQLISALVSTFSLIKSHYSSVGNNNGWVNDHARVSGIVESWSTAIVLTFLIHLHDAISLMRQRIILQKYKPLYDIYKDRIALWPELNSVLRSPSILIKSFLDDISDPTDNRKLTKSLLTQVLEPIEGSWIHRPKVSSLFLYGEPGTRKTGMAIRIGRSLDWPIIILSPPNFLRHGGLEGFEGAAEEIFQDLFKLKRVLVLFDECEEFFKKRDQGISTSSRTIGAFITAGMLPRLQMLNEKKWVLFIVGTNEGLDSFEPAVVRPGRFDKVQEISHPTLEAQNHYLKNKLQDEKIGQIVHDVLTKNKSPLEIPLSFSILDELVDVITGIRNRDHLNERVKAFLEEKHDRPGPSRLVD